MSREKTGEPFVRISEMARKASLPSSTIRHYTDLGLLKVAMQTDGGHFLYDAQSCLKRLSLIQALTKRGKSLPEIKEELEGRNSVLKILVVDDEVEVGSLLKDYFESKHPGRIKLETAQDGFSAGKKCMEFLPDVILLDLIMPGISGIEVCRLLRRDPDTAHAKILVITGYDTTENIQAVMQAGADGWMTKPFKLKDLIEKLQTIGVEIK